jgi:hypothetical protein
LNATKFAAGSVRLPLHTASLCIFTRSAALLMAIFLFSGLSAYAQYNSGIRGIFPTVQGHSSRGLVSL